LILKSGELTVLKPFESKTYVDLTIDMLSYFGFEFSVEENKTSVYYRLQKTPVRLHSYNEYKIEADYSSLAFLIALGVINNDIILRGVNQISLQADRKIIDILQRMGGKISFINKDELLIKKSTLVPTIIDLKECPDLGPILMAVTSMIKGKTRFINTKRLAYKESDRAKAMKDELEKLGAKITIMDNEIIVEGVNELPKGEIFESHNDHRVTMSLAIIATILKTPSYFKNTDCVKKSYPDFFTDLEKLGIGVRNA
jgi:3-phosphoshikimate 1-carboxyvinyltransferase